MQSFKEFISESKDYVFSITEIRKKYDFYNKKLFNNSLPKDINIEFNRKKRSVAMAISKKIKDGTRLIDVETHTISFSIAYTLSPTEFEGVLVHEMIHVATVKESIMFGDGMEHGREFKKELSRIRKLVDFKIPEKEDDFKIKDDGKPIHLIIKTTAGKTTVAAITKKIFDSNDAIEAAQWWKERAGGEYEIGTTTSVAAKDYKMNRMVWSKRKQMKIGFYSISDENLADVRAKFTLKVKY